LTITVPVDLERMPSHGGMNMQHGQMYGSGG
jgi:hypothetical protein